MKTKTALPLIMLLAVAMPALAVNHIITFGSSLRYSPASLTVQVGDTITWQGSFSSHPLESTSVPSGAAVFGRGTGTTFSYPVTVAGNYTYRCSIHFSAGMVGQFTAVETSTGVEKTLASADVKVYPTSTNDVVNISLTNYNGSLLHAEVLDAKGSLLNKDIALANGITSLSLADFAKGAYFLLIRNENEILSVNKVVKQ